MVKAPKSGESGEKVFNRIRIIRTIKDNRINYLLLLLLYSYVIVGKCSYPPIFIFTLHCIGALQVKELFGGGGGVRLMGRGVDGHPTTLFIFRLKKWLQATNDVACVSVVKKHLFATLGQKPPHSPRFSTTSGICLLDG